MTYFEDFPDLRIQSFVVGFCSFWPSFSPFPSDPDSMLSRNSTWKTQQYLAVRKKLPNLKMDPRETTKKTRTKMKPWRWKMVSKLKQISEVYQWIMHFIQSFGNCKTSFEILT